MDASRVVRGADAASGGASVLTESLVGTREVSATPSFARHPPPACMQDPGGRGPPKRTVGLETRGRAVAAARMLVKVQNMNCGCKPGGSISILWAVNHEPYVLDSFVIHHPTRNSFSRSTRHAAASSLWLAATAVGHQELLRVRRHHHATRSPRLTRAKGTIAPPPPAPPCLPLRQRQRLRLALQPRTRTRTRSRRSRSLPRSM